MNAFVLIFTSISVSADSFFCGLSLSYHSQNNLKSLKGVIISVFLLCFLGANLGAKFNYVLEKYVNLLSGFVFLIFGLKNCKENNENLSSFLLVKKDNSFLNSLILGGSVGVDGAVGSFTLTVKGYNALFVTILITAIHVLFMLLSFLVKHNLKKMPLNLDKLPSILLIALGTNKLMNFLN